MFKKLDLILFWIYPIIFFIMGVVLSHIASEHIGLFFCLIIIFLGIDFSIKMGALNSYEKKYGDADIEDTKEMVVVSWKKLIEGD
jgi:positive regulator of sigma E activity